MKEDDIQDDSNLTNSQKQRVIDFKDQLQNLMKKSKKNISFMPGTVLEFDRESIFKDKWIGTITGYYFATDAQDDSMDPYDHLLKVRNNKTGETRTIHPNKITRIIKNAIIISELKKGNILEIKKLNETKSYIGTVLDITCDNSGVYHARLKNNKTEKIEIVKQIDIVKIIC